MSTGVFINFEVPFVKMETAVPAENQAEQILQKADELVASGAIGVAITYSANYGQTREIQRVYFAGGWKTRTDGANQAAVMRCMESLLGGNHQSLQGRMRILPITTMNAYDDPASPWNADVLLGIVTTDLDRIKTYLEAGWCVLGWQNQNTVGDPKHPYAVGGGVAQLPDAVADKIQNTLIGYAKTYAK